MADREAPWPIVGAGLSAAALAALIGVAGARSRGPQINAAKLQVGLLGRKLQALRPLFAKAAQEIVDGWEQDEEGFCEDYGTGGVCDDVARAFVSVVAKHIPEAGMVEGGQDGDDHVFIVVFNDTEAYEVDIPPGVYETGGGYNWKKIAGAKIGPEDVIVQRIERGWIQGDD